MVFAFVEFTRGCTLHAFIGQCKFRIVQRQRTWVDQGGSPLALLSWDLTLSNPHDALRWVQPELLFSEIKNPPIIL